MNTFKNNYQNYIANSVAHPQEFGFDLAKIEKIEPFLSFLYHYWWRVDITGLQFLPQTGPALIVGNSGSVLPWPSMMLLIALMRNKENSRRLNIFCDMDWIEDTNLKAFLSKIGFLNWSATSAKQLFDAGEIAIIFPEGIPGITKPYSQRYRLREFDWTRFMPAIQENVPVFPLATIGCDEATPVISNFKKLAQLAGTPAFPLTPFFPWLPYPFNLLLSFPIKWSMRILKSNHYEIPNDRTHLEELAKKQAFFLEGEIQAEINRLLRARKRALI